jgi:hypothetical protein
MVNYEKPIENDWEIVLFTFIHTYDEVVEDRGDGTLGSSLGTMM